MDKLETCPTASRPRTPWTRHPSPRIQYPISNIAPQAPLVSRPQKYKRIILNNRGRFGIYSLCTMIRLIQGSVMMVAWVFLVLPSCPCKVMSLFGVDLHGNQSLTTLEAGHSVLRGKNRDAHGIPCHCDEEHAKSAVLVDGESDAEGDEPAVEPLFVHSDRRMSARVTLDGGPELTRPPPGGERFPFPQRAVFAVYRL